MVGSYTKARAHSRKQGCDRLSIYCTGPPLTPTPGGESAFPSVCQGAFWVPREAGPAILTRTVPGRKARPPKLLPRPEDLSPGRLGVVEVPGALRFAIMPPLRFAANLAWLFQEEVTLPGRMEAAARAGFRAAELSFPYACGPADLRAAADRAGLELVLLNTPPGNQEKGDMGLGAVPGRQHEFREALALAVKYAKDLKCPRIHIMAGRMPFGAEQEAVSAEMEATFVENLKYAADILAQENLVGLLEPINSRITDPQYFLTTPQQGHIQIAQVPTRHEPSSAGELNFPYLFQLLESKNYRGYVGCEYKPQEDTLKGLIWLREYWESNGLQHGGS